MSGIPQGLRNSTLFDSVWAYIVLQADTALQYFKLLWVGPLLWTLLCMLVTHIDLAYVNIEMLL